MRINLCKVLPIPLVFMLVLFSGCGKELEKNVTLPEVPLMDIVAVNVESKMGNITLEPGSGSAVEAEAILLVEAPDRDRRKTLSESILITTDTSDPSLLTIISRLSEAITLREGEKVVIDLNIKIPPKIKSVVVQSDTGDITLEGLTCALNVVNNTGSVTVKDTVLTGKNNISNVVGDVNVKLKNIESAEEISVVANIGNIRFNVPRRSSYTVTVEELSNKGDTWKNKDGKTKLLLSTKVGKISFQK